MTPIIQPGTALARLGVTELTVQRGTTGTYAPTARAADTLARHGVRSTVVDTLPYVQSAASFIVQVCFMIIAVQR